MLPLAPGEAADRGWMRRALRLAERGFTPPNPMVGCVVVREGRVVGEGWHVAAGAPHAEVVALSAAGPAARGATAYVSLEPCAHYGRTPPCVLSLIEAGVARVVAACVDPDPRVAGRGLQRLRQAGIRVDVGVLEAEARSLNAAFFHFHASGRPLVTLKAAVTLDGKIATRTGDSRWVTGPRARRFAHRLRARSGGVLCGIGTVLIDDPLLTSRIAAVPRQPLRVVLDTHLRTPLNAALVRTAGESPVLIAASRDADAAAALRLETAGVEILRLPVEQPGRLCLEPLLADLGRRGLISLLVEGGSQVHASFIEGRYADRLLWFIAPKILGGTDAPGAVGGKGPEQMGQAVGLTDVRIRRLAPDLLIEAVPRYPSR